MAPVERLYRVKRKFDLDPDTLHCPICTEAFSPPVFQVPILQACRCFVSVSLRNITVSFHFGVIWDQLVVLMT